MKSIIIMVGILSLIMLVGCGNLGEDNLSHNWYKGITDAEVPNSCLDSQDDVCGLFDCMVNMCWCDDSSPDLPILYEEIGVVITNEEEAVTHVNKYLKEKRLKGTEEGDLFGKIYMIEAKKAVKLNNIFYNVFAEDDRGDEIVYTVVVDGTIIKTICGI